MKNSFELYVLFVEDDLVDQMALKRMAAKNAVFRKYDFSDSIEDALVKLKDNEYDVIVTDYHLRDGVGVEIIGKAGKKPVIMVTGMGDESLAVGAMKAGAVDYMVKDPHNGHLEILPLAICKAHEQYVQSVIYKEAEERYHDLFENSTDLIQSVDPEGKFVYVNPSWKLTLGFTDSEVKKMNFFDIVHPQFQQHCKQIFENTEKGQSYHNEEIWFVSKSGETVMVEGNINSRMDVYGNPIAIRGIFRDVTERRKVEGQLKKSEKQYRLLVESANDIIYYTDENGNLRFINKHGPAFTGYSQEELLMINFTELVAKEYRDHVTSFYNKQFIEKKEITYLEFPLKRKDGEKLWVGQSVRTLYDEDNPDVVAGFLSVVRDINEKKKMEEQLKMSNQILEKRVSWRTRELEKINSKLRKEIELRTNVEIALKTSEEEYKGLFQNAHDAIVIYDAQTEIILNVNRQACEIYGYDSEDFIGLSVNKISKRSKKDRLQISDTIERGVYKNFEAIHKSSDGKNMILEVNATRLVYKGKDAILSINSDVTQERQIEKRLMNERIRRMTALIDGQEMERKRLSRELHDGLGQMLTASLIYLRQLYHVVDNKKDIKLIDTTQEILENTIEEVRTISHDLMPAVLGDFGLELALKNMSNKINGQFSGSVSFRSSSKLERLRQDVEIGLYRIAQEALNNALKYSEANKIDISLTAQNGSQIITIKDDGKGFDLNSKLESKSGNGIYNMSQRSKLIGCDFDIISSPAKGTKIVVKHTNTG